LIESHC